MKRTVLIADDDELVREAVVSTLEEAGYRVLAAEDGARGWRLLQDEGADLAVLDLNMPCVDGIELTRRIRADKRLRDMPVLMLSIRDLVEDQVAGYRQGADDYLTKPFDGDVLVARVRLLEARILGERGGPAQGRKLA